MANKRIKDLATTATTPTGDDFVALDGDTNNTRKMSAANMALKNTANTFTQNQTLDGTNNVAPNQTAASGSSLMTRDLVDARNTALWVPIGGRPNHTATNGAINVFLMWGSATTGETYMVPATHKTLSAMYINIAYTTAPLTTNFSVSILFGNSTGGNAASGGNAQTLTGTITNVSGNRYKWTLDAPTTLTPNNDDAGAYYVAQISWTNNTGGSLTTVAGNVQTQGYMLLLP